MPFSIWEYLRQRTRDSVLAGIQDAMDIAEQGDTNGSQHDQAKRLVSNLGGSGNGTSEAKQLPHASTNGHDEAAVPQAEPASTSPEAPQRPSDESAFDDELESRLNAAASQGAAQGRPSANGHQPKKKPEPPLLTKRGPGRPRKDEKQ